MKVIDEQSEAVKREKERLSRLRFTERLIQQGKRKSVVIEEVADKFHLTLNYAADFYEKAKARIIEDEIRDKDVRRSMQLSELALIKEHLIEKGDMGKLLDCMKIEMDLTGTKAPQEIDVGTSQFSKYLELRQKELELIANKAIEVKQLESGSNRETGNPERNVDL